MQRHHVKPVKQVFAESSLFHHFRQIAVGRGNDPHIHPHGHVATHPLKFALLNRPQQFHLQRQRQLAHFIDKQGAAGCDFEFSRLGGDCASKSAFFMPEQLALHQAFGNGAAVNADKRLVVAQAVFMDRLGDDFLAATAFAGNQHRRIALRHTANRLEQVLHHGAATDNQIVRRCHAVLAGQKPFFLLLADSQRPFQHGSHFRHIGRLYQIVEHAFFHCLHGDADIAKSGQQDNLDLRHLLVNDFESLHAFHHRHAQIHQYHSRIDLAAFFHALQAIFGLKRLIAGLAHDFTQQMTHIQFIIDNQNPFHLFHSLASSIFPAGKLSTKELPTPLADST